MTTEGGGTLARARVVLSLRDFRQLVFVRLCTQFGDGLFQAVILGSVVFSPTKHSASVGVAKALAILVVPYSLVGPFAGVFIDRWPRKLILVVTLSMMVTSEWQMPQWCTRTSTCPGPGSSVSTSSTSVNGVWPPA